MGYRIDNLNLIILSKYFGLVILFIAINHISITIRIVAIKIK